MENRTPALEARRTASDSALAPGCALVLAAWFGVVGGALDLGMIFLNRDFFHSSPYYEQGRNFRWVVPVANLLVMMAPGLAVALVSWFRPGLISRRTAAWLFATLAIWGPLLRAPLYGMATLLLAVGAGGVVSRRFAQRDSGFQRLARYSLPVLLAVIGTTAVVTSVQQARMESQSLARLPAPPAGAGNVLLIVMDTVRASSLGLYGYARDTTPHLARWAKKGVRFEWALAPAPWTFPSHCSIMTGRWPSTLGAHWVPNLDPAYPTLAEFLASHGYLTCGFAANTAWCSYESGMDRGFAHYEDYPLSMSTILRRTMPGRWILENALNSRDYHSIKWIRSQSRDAAEINQSFLDWLAGEKHRQRPFFAFLNYFDAHEPFLPPEGNRIHFGLRPESPSDFRLLLEYWDRDKVKLSDREVKLARDSYDDCITTLDCQVGSLLDELDRREVLRDTLVIITSDHGEEFGEHGVFTHGFSLYSNVVHVPLLIISKAAQPGLSVSEPVSLRDIPATVAELSGLGSGAPFPGRSMTEYWSKTPESEKTRSAQAVSEVDIPVEIGPERGHGPKQRGFTMSLVAEGMHYLVDIRGTEELYELAADPRELHNLKDDPRQTAALGRFRTSLAAFLRDNRIQTGVAADYQEQLRKLLRQWAPRQTI